jgi:hypothetical protein
MGEPNKSIVDGICASVIGRTGRLGQGDRDRSVHLVLITDRPSIGLRGRHPDIVMLFGYSQALHYLALRPVDAVFA